MFQLLYTLSQAVFTDQIQIQSVAEELDLNCMYNNKHIFG